jgi:hypothetical protein
VCGGQHHFGPELEFGYVVGELTGEALGRAMLSLTPDAARAP